MNFTVHYMNSMNIGIDDDQTDFALQRFICLTGIKADRPLVARHLYFRFPIRMSSVQNYILQ